ncbi:MAG: hypothetical protein QOF16_1413 [Actinomycetota bacterium]|nr:hypothetical protein [Actinomycetota bacterium]
MTISAVHRFVGVALVAVLSTACGTSSGPSLDSVSKRASDAAAAVSSLRSEVAGLKSQLQAAAAAKKKTLDHVAALNHQLNKAVARLDRATRDAKTAAKTASSSASSALADAQQAIRDLAILTQRFDYHLRHSGGQ